MSTASAQARAEDGQLERPAPTGLALVIQRLADNPSVEALETLERIIKLQERMDAQRAKMAFDAAMSAAQSEMRRVGRDGNNPQTHSRYATYAAIDRALRPTYTKHGFGLSFNTGSDAPPDHVRVLCEVTHRDGFAKSYHIDMPADGKGAKGGDVMTRTHAAGSAVSYGMRYLLKMIFNVAVGEDDDDGNRAGNGNGAQQPDGLEGFWDDLMTAADNGIQALQAVWDVPAKKPLRIYIHKQQARQWAELKARAEKVKR